MDWLALDEITHVSRPVEEILKSRKVQDVEKFLHPKLKDLYAPEFDPFLLKDMNIAIPRIAHAIESGEKIMIEGDYDCDGVTSTSVFLMGLRDLNADVIYHIPLRKDGYGLSRKAVDMAYNAGVTLILTCDNGIAAIDAVDYAKSLGIDVIVTDHHEPQEEIPKAFAVIDPKQKDCPYPTEELAGCGVVFKVLQALNLFMNGDIRKPEKYLDIVCIGTVGDVMKLVGENRIITKYGLEYLSVTENRGLIQLLRALSLDDKDEITTRQLGFQIVPCLNAAGRLHDAMEAVQMLTTASKRDAFRTANKLKQFNDERRKLSEEWQKKLIDYLEDNPRILENTILVIPAEEEIPEGIVGIIAGRIKDRYQKPTILLSPTDDPDIFKGSGRSVKAYNMFEEMLPHKHLTEAFGGHEAACGLKIKRKNIKKYSKLLNEACTLTEEDLMPKLFIDYEIEPELLQQSFVEELELMEPFGNGNQKPLFLLRDVMVNYPKGIGAKQQHLKFQGQCNDEFIDMIGWNMIEKWEALGKPKFLDVVFYPGLNTWNNNTKVQLEMQDIRVAQ